MQELLLYRQLMLEEGQDPAAVELTVVAAAHPCFQSQIAYCC